MARRLSRCFVAQVYVAQLMLKCAARGKAELLDFEAPHMFGPCSVHRGGCRSLQDAAWDHEVSGR